MRGDGQGGQESDVSTSSRAMLVRQRDDKIEKPACPQTADLRPQHAANRTAHPTHSLIFWRRV